MPKLINRFRRDERAATATEYAVLIVFVALAIAVGANILGNDLSAQEVSGFGYLSGHGRERPRPAWVDDFFERPSGHGETL